VSIQLLKTLELYTSLIKRVVYKVEANPIIINLMNVYLFIIDNMTTQDKVKEVIKEAQDIA